MSKTASTPGLNQSKYQTAPTTGRQDRRPRNGIRNPPLTGHAAANSRAFNPNASQINTGNLAPFANRPILGGPWGGDFEGSLRQGDRALKAEIAVREDAMEESGDAPRPVFNQTYKGPRTGQKIKEEDEDVEERRFE